MNPFWSDGLRYFWTPFRNSLRVADVSLPATFVCSVCSAASVKKIVSIVVSVQYFSANHSYT